MTLPSSVNRMIVAVALLIVGAAPASAAAASAKDERASLIAHAKVWAPTDIPSMDLMNGPAAQDGFPPGATVECTWLDKTLSGRSPKIACLRAADDELKVKYGGNNGEVYGEVLATRLLWALGFGADRMYSVRVICKGCPEKVGGIVREDGRRILDPATVERKLPGTELEPDGKIGWSWKELDEIKEGAGGATRAERDALKLLAILMQHTDTKPQQQRLVCLDAIPEGGECPRPFMMLNDVGLTFGKANMFNANTPGAVNLAAWSKIPVWNGATGCEGQLAESATATLVDTKISEAGRQFLTGLLMQLSDAQLHDLFAAARVNLRTRDPKNGRSGFATVGEWVDAFKQKRAEIAERRCS